MSLFRFLLNLFKGHKSGYSIKGFWGQIKHYNKDGIQIGYTVKGFWGQRKRYDMDGNLISYSVKNFFGGYNTYDANGNLISRSYKNIFGGYNTYDKYGNKKRVSRKGFWDVMLHFDIENPDPYESIVTVKRTSSKKTTASHYKNASVQVPDDKVYNSEPLQQSKVSASATVATEPKEKTTKSKAAVSNSYTENVKATENVKKVVSDEHVGVDVVSYSKDVSAGALNPNRTSRYYQSVDAFLKNKPISQYAKLLVFQYKKLEEFPAIAYLHGNMVRVEPLLAGAEAFEFFVSEIEKAKEVHVTGLDMDVMDNEFLACSMSDLGKEFENLLPEYPFGNDGMYRTQYVFECGMVITEKSMKELRRILN